MQNSKILTSGGELCHVVGPDLSNICLHRRHYLYGFLVLSAIFLSLHLPPLATYSEEIHIWTQPLLKIRKQYKRVYVWGG